MKYYRLTDYIQNEKNTEYSLFSDIHIKHVLSRVRRNCERLQINKRIHFIDWCGEIYQIDWNEHELIEIC